MRRILLVISMVALSLSTNAQLLYRISGKGLARPSYLLGTYHFCASSFVDSIPGFHEAMDNSEQACGELVMADIGNLENVMKMQKAMMLPEGKSIQSMLKPEDLSALNGLLRQVMGADLSTPGMGEALGKMTPAALITQLSALMYLKYDPNASAQDGIDAHVQDLAKEKGKKVLGVETVDDQINVLFNSQTVERQLQMLMCMVKHQDEQVQMTGKIVKAYRSQDLDAVLQLTDEKFNDECDSTEEEENALIYGRNAKWVEAMPAMMGEAPTFFAFGAAHLPGEKGVIQLLRNAGYTVEGMK